MHPIGEKWREIRNALTPTLSSSRIKAMVATTKDVVKEFTARLSAELVESDAGKMSIEIRE